MTHAGRVLLFLLGLSGLGMASVGAAQEAGETVIIRTATNDDLYAAGQDVSVEAAVAGDAVLAGSRVVVTGTIRDDILAAGRSVTVSGDVGDDVRLAGETVTVSGQVTGHVAMAGSEARIESGSRIGDWAWLAGNRVYVGGDIGRELKAAGNTVELTGRVDGDADIAANRIRIGDGAVIDGDLTWRSDNEPEISDGATITGEIIEGTLPDFDDEDGFVFRLLRILAVIFAAGVLYSVFRSDCDSCAMVLETRPAFCLLIGLANFATTPLLAALLFATGVGALLGAIVLLAYGLALLLGFMAGVTSLARLGLRVGRRNRDGEPALWQVWVAIALVAIAISVIGPFGIPVGFFLMLFGLGTLSLETYQRVRL